MAVFFQRNIFRIIGFFISVSLLGCSSPPVKSTFPSGADKQAPKIVVVPFQVVSPGEHMRTALCPLTSGIFQACVSPKGSEQLLEQIFLNKLQQTYHYKPIFADEAPLPSSGLAPASPKSAQLKKLMAIGEKSNADAVLTGYLFCFRERVGYAYSAEKPASVAFGVYLVRVKDGSLIWSGVFEKTQKSLFENVLQLPSFIKEKGKWVQAEFLLQEGVDQIIKTFPDLH